jgi:Flp pilus assembly protein TadG
MRRRTTGQSIVEMAFVLPFLLVVIFGIVEFGYLIFAYSTVSQAARNGAETAAQLPPYETWLNYKDNEPTAADFPGWRGDPCVNAVMEAVESDLTLFGGNINESRDVADYVVIRYPSGGTTRNLTVRGPIEVSITYPVSGITPLFQLLNLNGDGTITLRVTQRRSLENLGLDPTKPRGVACAKDLADYRELYPNP